MTKRNIKPYIRVMIILVSILVLVSLVYTQDVYIQTQRTTTKMVVLLNEWVSKSGTGSVNEAVRNLSGITKYDLEFTGLFDVVTTSQDINAPFDFGFLKELKAVAATKGTYILNGGQLEIDTDVYDVAKGTMSWQKAYEGPIASNRDMMHRFSDAVLYSFGLPGFCNSKIAYISNAKGNKEVYMMDYDGHNVVQLTENKSINLSPSWSPDTTKIAYVSYTRGNPDLFVVDVKTKATRCIASYPGLNAAPSWSPDGKYIAVSLTKDGNGEIYILHADGNGAPRRLTFNRWIDTSPCWSPSGNQIAFVSDQTGRPQIYIMDATGGNVRRLTYEGNYNASPNWSPRGDSIAYVTMQGNELNLCVIQVDGQNVRQLTTGFGNCENPSWSPDGRNLTFCSNHLGNEQIYSIRVADNQIVQLSNFKGRNTEPDWSK